MPEYIFTFGSSHSTPAIPNLLNYYCVINADNELAARLNMVRLRGKKWSMVYHTKEAAGVKQYHLKELSINEL